MAKGNANEAIKKHHFWILFGLSFLFVALALVFMMTGVSSAIQAAAKKNDEDVKKVKGTQPPGKGVIEGLEAQKAVLEKKKDDLWKENWDFQAKYFTWPRHSENLFAKYEGLKFGTDINAQLSTYEKEQLKLPTVYKRAYEEAAAKIAPTKFAGGSWQNVLRWVSNWGEKLPDSRQVWLLMEDLWVQRALLDSIAAVNGDIARFHAVNDPADPVAPVDPAVPAPEPKKKVFRSRVWELSLEVLDGGPTGQQLKVRLKNLTPQLQLLGMGNQMIVNVWLDKRTLAPFELPIQGAFIPGGGVYPPDEVTDPQTKKVSKGEPLLVPITPGLSVTELWKVEQKLDELSVPVRSLDTVQLGYLSNKNAVLLAKEGKALEPPKFWPDDAAAADPAGGGVGGAPPGMSMTMPPGMASEGGGGKFGPPGGGGDGPAGMGGYPGMMGGGLGGRAAGGTLVGTADANRKRYITLTDQIRRMPVAFTVVCDQMYIQDTLIAFANSPLRFEAVQYHWKRANRAPGVQAGGGAAGSPGYEGSEGGAIVGYAGGGLSAGYGGYPGGPPPGMGGPGVSPPVGRGGPDAGDGPAGSPGPSMPPFGPSGGFGAFGGFGGFGGSLFSTISDAQANSGLVELTVYGIVSLYEKYDAKKEGDAAAPPADAPKTDAPKADTPAAPAGDAAAPKGDAPKPADAAPKGDSPKTETPAPPAPKGETPAEPKGGEPKK
jgi:hypothetical protein